MEIEVSREDEESSLEERYRVYWRLACPTTQEGLKKLADYLWCSAEAETDADVAMNAEQELRAMGWPPDDGEEAIEWILRAIEVAVALRVRWSP